MKLFTPDSPFTILSALKPTIFDILEKMRERNLDELPGIIPLPEKPPIKYRATLQNGKHGVLRLENYPVKFRNVSYEVDFAIILDSPFDPNAILGAHHIELEGLTFTPIPQGFILWLETEVCHAWNGN